MFKIDNELKSANIPRTIRFTEPLFEKLNKTAEETNRFFGSLLFIICPLVQAFRECRSTSYISFRFRRGTGHSGQPFCPFLRARA